MSNLALSMTLGWVRRISDPVYICQNFLKAHADGTYPSLITVFFKFLTAKAESKLLSKNKLDTLIF